MNVNYKWRKKKKFGIPSIIEDVEQLDDSYLAGHSKKLWKHFKKTGGLCFIMLNYAYFIIQHFQSYMDKNVLGNFIFKKGNVWKQFKCTRTSKRIKQMVIYSYNGISLSTEKEQTANSKTWVTLRVFIK